MRRSCRDASHPGMCRDTRTVDRKHPANDRAARSHSGISCRAASARRLTSQMQAKRPASAIRAATATGINGNGLRAGFSNGSGQSGPCIAAPCSTAAEAACAEEAGIAAGFALDATRVAAWCSRLTSPWRSVTGTISGACHHKMLTAAITERSKITARMDHPTSTASPRSMAHSAACRQDRVNQFSRSIAWKEHS